MNTVQSTPPKLLSTATCLDNAVVELPLGELILHSVAAGVEVLMKDETGVGLSGVYRWLKRQSNKDPIGDMLQEIQDTSDEAKKEINRSGSKDVQLTYLRQAVDKGYVSIERIYQLLHRVEETGQQRIYLLKPKDAVRDLLADGAKVATKLFGEAWGGDYFPSFEWPRSNYIWADVRLGLPGLPNDWLIKVYGHSVKKIKTHEATEEELEDGEYVETRRYKKESTYSVNVFRWRNPGILEVRIDKENAPNKKAANARYEAVVAKFAPVYDIERIASFSLKDLCRKMWLERQVEGAENPLFSVGRVKLFDSDQGTITFRPQLRDEHVDTNLARSASLTKFLEHKAVPMESDILLKFDAEQQARFGVESLPITIGGDRWNEIVISRRISPELYDHVISRFVG
jgi:hypothetical protein